MALLRNREVQILRVANEVDGSTFVVRYPDAETEMVKMHELTFTQNEYDQFVKPDLPSVQIMSDADMKARLDQLKADEDRPGTDAYKAKQERIKQEDKAREEEVKPQTVKQTASLDGAKVQTKTGETHAVTKSPTSTVKTPQADKINPNPVNSKTPVNVVNKP